MSEHRYDEAMRVCAGWVAVLSGCTFHAPSSATDAVTGGDVPLAIDAPANDALASNIIEAEAFSSMTMPSTKLWSLQTDDPAASAAAYMQCGPGDGNPCDDNTMLDGCAAALLYPLSIDELTLYHVHVRVRSTSGADDSVWYGIDNVPEPSPTILTNDGQWHWKTGATTFTLGPGSHTLTIWQRECGLRIDVVAVTKSATPPP